MASVKEPNLARRAAGLLVFAIGFWMLAVCAVGGLFALGGWILEYAPDSVFAAFGCWMLAVALVIAFLPGRSRPSVSAHPNAIGEPPRLRALVREVAAALGGREPDRILVFHEANAFASERRPHVFAKRETVIGIGLPLLALLDHDELRSVVAHEMGHHLGSDVKLGPWVYRTRRAMARALDRFEGASLWVHLPFVLYAKAFLRSSLRVSRAQELAADRCAARVAGREAAASALRKIEILGSAWSHYFRSEVIPVVDLKRLPALLDGFALYWEAARDPETPAYEQLAASLSGPATTNAEDTHPSLADRLAALGDPVSPAVGMETSLGLLAPLVEAYEGSRTGGGSGGDEAVEWAEDGVVRDLLVDATTRLLRVGWDAVGEEVWLKRWRTMVAEAPVLKGLSVAELPQALQAWEHIAAKTRRGPAFTSPLAEKQRVTGLLSVWLAVALADAGFRIAALPGFSVRAERGEDSFEPFVLVPALAKGEIDAAEWGRLCAPLSHAA